MSKIKWKGGTLLAPVPPAMVSCGTVDRPNMLTVAWTGIINSDPPMTYISVRPERYSHPIISESGEFVINLTSEAMCDACDFCGIRSGRDVDKFAHTGLTAGKSFEVSAPMIEESPLSLECRVKSVTTLGTHDMFIADIVAVSVDQRFIDKTGKLHVEDFGLVAYGHGQYFSLGKRLGTFGYTVKKKK